MCTAISKVQVHKQKMCLIVNIYGCNESFRFCVFLTLTKIIFALIVDKTIVNLLEGYLNWLINQDVHKLYCHGIKRNCLSIIRFLFPIKAI